MIFIGGYMKYLIPKKYFTVQGVVVSISLQSACPWKNSFEVTTRKGEKNDAKKNFS